MLPHFPRVFLQDPCKAGDGWKPELEWRAGVEDLGAGRSTVHGTGTDLFIHQSFIHNVDHILSLNVPSMLKHLPSICLVF